MVRRRRSWEDMVSKIAFSMMGAAIMGAASMMGNNYDPSFNHRTTEDKPKKVKSRKNKAQKAARKISRKK